MTDTAVRPRRVLRTVLVVLAVVGAGTVAVGALVYCSIFGCTVFSEDFEPHGEQASEARAAAGPAGAAFADRLVAQGRVIARGVRDTCEEGQYNWKVKDTYSGECELETSRLLLVTDDRDDVADGLTAADAALRALGCRPQSPRDGLDLVRDEYWLGASSQVIRRGASGLPSTRYDCDGDRVVEVEPTSRQDDGITGWASGTYADVIVEDDWYSGDDLRLVRDAQAELALVVTVVDPYYRTRF